MSQYLRKQLCKLEELSSALVGKLRRGRVVALCDNPENPLLIGGSFLYPSFKSCLQKWNLCWQSYKYLRPASKLTRMKLSLNNELLSGQQVLQRASNSRQGVLVSRVQISTVWQHQSCLVATVPAAAILGILLFNEAWGPSLTSDTCEMYFQMLCLLSHSCVPCKVSHVLKICAWVLTPLLSPVSMLPHQANYRTSHSVFKSFSDYPSWMAVRPCFLSAVRRPYKVKSPWYY